VRAVGAAAMGEGPEMTGYFALQGALGGPAGGEYAPEIGRFSESGQTSPPVMHRSRLIRGRQAVW
jgi:hypothetical protein